MAERPTRLPVDTRRGAVSVTRKGISARRSSRVTHDVATLVLVTRGHASLEQRGRRWSVSPGDAAIVPVAEPHRWVEAKDADCWQLSFCVPCLLAESPTLLNILEHVSAARAERSPIFPIPANRLAFVETLFKELERAPTSPEVERSLVLLLLSELTESAGAAARPGLVPAALDFIERNCLRPLTLSEIARAVGRTPAHVTTAIKQATGQSAHTWIIAGRMAEARRLLLHSDASMEGIAEAVGYRDVTHFIRVFRREHSQTPAAWRTAHRPGR